MEEEFHEVDDEEEILMPQVEDVGEGETEVAHVNGIIAQKRSLILPMILYADRPYQTWVKVLIDTGCEVDLIHRGLIHKRHFRPATKRVRLVTANKTLLGGGIYTVDLDLGCKGVRMHDGNLNLLEFPTTLYEADINIDIILSFKCCRYYNIDITCGLYGLQFEYYDYQYFIQGMEEPEPNDELNH